MVNAALSGGANFAKTVEILVTQAWRNISAAP
jgi:hypothetical protein